MIARFFTLLATATLLGGCTVDAASISQAIASIQSAQAQAANQVQTRQGAAPQASSTEDDVAAVPAGDPAQGLMGGGTGGTRPQPPQQQRQQRR